MNKYTPKHNRYIPMNERVAPKAKKTTRIVTLTFVGIAGEVATCVLSGTFDFSNTLNELVARHWKVESDVTK